MPLRQLTPFVAALPHVRAIASLRSAEAISVGTGTMKESARRETAGRWRSDVRSTSSARRARTPADVARAATAAGIEFRRVVPAGPDTDATGGRVGEAPSSAP